MRDIKAAIQMALYTAAFMAVVLIPHALAYAVIPDTAHGGLTFTQCATEDSTNCYWDANVQGNGTGNSFIDVNGTAYYVR